MATSPNYGWLEPDNTDLVKNGALAIRTLGNAIDTTMATMTPKSIVDAKGDLIAASAADTPARLAVGNNGETLVADSSTSTGLRYTAGTVQSNPILNSAMQIWQRGTSISLAASIGGFVADRWYTSTGTNQACTISRQATNDTTNLPFIQYAMRYQRNSGQTGTGGLNLTQSLESINAIPYAGKTVTLSFYARAGANYSAASNALSVLLISGTGTDQNRGTTGYTGEAYPISSTATLTTTWQRFTYTGTLASTVTEFAFYASFVPTGTAGTNDWYELTGVQIDIGSVALPFRTYAGTIQGELAACQRYYQRITPATVGASFSGFAATTSQALFNVPFAQTMRTAPTALEQTGTATDYAIRSTAGNTNCNTVPTFISASNAYMVIDGQVAAALTAGQGVLFRFNNAGVTYLGWSAEL